LVTAPSPSPKLTTHTLAFWLECLLLLASVAFFALHFLHLSADFPNHSPWVDWSKYTDEGWYGDAAIRHYTSGHWYWPGDFNPAVALPLWPALELLVFRFTGVSAAAARATTLVSFAVTLVGFYALLRKFARVRRQQSAPSLAPALCVFFLALSPFFFVFERMAILEPLLITLTVLAMLCASSLGRPRRLLSVALGLLLPAMVLTKTTAIFLFPAILYLLWARAGYRLKPALRLAIPPAMLGLTLWLAYFVFFVTPHYLPDYQYLFSANGYTGILLEPVDKVVLATLQDGIWIGRLLYPAFFAVLALVLFWRPRLFTNPLVPALLLWIGGYFAFLAYHNNLQPRYYLVAAAPVAAFVALGLDSFRQAASRRREILATLAIMAVAVGIALPGALYTVHIATHPTYEFLQASRNIAAIVRADPTHNPLILSISGSDITLMTGLPSIDDDFGTLELGARVQQYKPGWYVAWNELDDDKMDAISPAYNPVRVAAFPALDDPDRNLLILYRLNPAEAATVTSAETSAEAPARSPTPHHPQATPKPLLTKGGQQPTTQQLEH
jgi:4-amino-4-deoxy-L-arabinose transferase-like glycosyltransferase